MEYFGSIVVHGQPGLFLGAFLFVNVIFGVFSRAKVKA